MAGAGERAEGAVLIWETARGPATNRDILREPGTLPLGEPAPTGREEGRLLPIHLFIACAAPQTGLHEELGREGSAGPEEVEPTRDAPERPIRAMTEDPTGTIEDAPWLEVPDDEDADAFYAEGTIHDIHLTLPEASRASLGLNPRVDVEGTFRSGGHSWPVGIRLKGTTTFRTLSGKAAFKVDFHHVDPEGRFHGRKRLTLNSMLQDSSMLHEHTAYWLYRARGVPAPRHTFARVWVNDEHYGLYGVVESMDEQLLDQVFPDDEDGNLYEANLADFHVGEEHKYELEEASLVVTPYTDLEALTATLAAAPPTGFLDALTATFDVDTLMRMFAVDLVSGNVDGYTQLRNNYMVYNAVNTGKWYLMPWGHDQSMQWHGHVVPYEKSVGLLVERCAADPACVARLTQDIEELLVVWEDGAFASMVSDATTLVQGECAADPRAEFACDTAHVLPFVLARPETVREDLAEAAAEAVE